MKYLTTTLEKKVTRGSWFSTGVRIAALFSVVSLMGAGVSRGAQILSNSDFSSPMVTGVGASATLITTTTPDVWNSNAFWTYNATDDQVEFENTSNRRRDNFQYVTNVAAGAATLSLTINILGADPKIGVDIWAWNSDDAPTFDLAMGIVNPALQGNSGNFSEPNGADVVFSNYLLHDNLSEVSEFETLVFNFDLLESYEFLAVRFQGAKTDDNPDEHLWVSNITLDLVPIPEPTAIFLSVIGLFGVCTLGRRNRRNMKA